MSLKRDENPVNEFHMPHGRQAYDDPTSHLELELSELKPADTGFQRLLS